MEARKQRRCHESVANKHSVHTLLPLFYIPTWFPETTKQALGDILSAAMAASHVLFLCWVVWQLLACPGEGLNIGIQSTDDSVSVRKECSRKCESEFCSVPPFLRYGKYCGLLYSGCPGEKPCDGLDACCKMHDDCVQARNNDYLSQGCNQHFLDCISKFKHAGEHSFKGNKCKVDEVIDVISVVIKAALVTGRILHRP